MLTSSPCLLPFKIYYGNLGIHALVFWLFRDITELQKSIMRSRQCNMRGVARPSIEEKDWNGFFLVWKWPPDSFFSHKLRQLALHCEMQRRKSLTRWCDIYFIDITRHTCPSSSLHPGFWEIYWTVKSSCCTSHTRHREQRAKLWRVSPSSCHRLQPFCT